MVSPIGNVQQIWPSKLDLLAQMGKTGQKMANGRLLFQALYLDSTEAYYDSEYYHHGNEFHQK